MTRIGTTITAAGALLALALSAAAQTPETARPGGTIALLGGAATTSTVGPLAGATFVYDLNARLSVEGQGAWLARGPGGDAVAVTGNLLVNLLPLGRRVVPYAAAGGGLYRASFDLAHERLMGAIGSGLGAGSEFCPSPGAGFMRGPASGFGGCTAPGGAFWGVGEMPGFYARRLGVMAVPAGGAWATRSFTDPAISLGGGVRFDLGPHLEVRPDARAIVVFDRRDAYTVGMFGVNLGYRF